MAWRFNFLNPEIIPYWSQTCLHLKQFYLRSSNNSHNKESSQGTYADSHPTALLHGYIWGSESEQVWEESQRPWAACYVLIHRRWSTWLPWCPFLPITFTLSKGLRRELLGACQLRTLNILKYPQLQPRRFLSRDWELNSRYVNLQARPAASELPGQFV